MKTTPQSLCYVMLFLACMSAQLGAAPELAPAGKFLVLRNGRTLEGDIERFDDQYRVRRNGAETWIPANMVLRLFRDTEDAYKFLLAKTPLNDADARLRLAEWCEEFNLRERAMQEALEADRLRPKDPETKRLIARLQQPPKPVEPAPARATLKPPDVTAPTLPAVDLTPESLGQFAQRVQPILLNACASCHVSGRGGSFKLVRTTEIPTMNRLVLQDNLRAVLGQLNPGQPPASPLLVKSVSIHGGTDKAPFRNRQAIPYQVIEEWVKTTLANNPQLRDHASATALPPPVATPLPQEAKSLFADVKSAAALPVEPPHPNVVPIAPVPPVVSPARSLQPPTAAKPPEDADDDFDPAAFNRQAHPQRDQPPPTP